MYSWIAVFWAEHIMLIFRLIFIILWLIWTYLHVLMFKIHFIFLVLSVWIYLDQHSVLTPVSYDIITINPDGEFNICTTFSIYLIVVETQNQKRHVSRKYCKSQYDSRGDDHECLQQIVHG